MKNPDILLAIKPVIKAFEKLDIPYYIGGSIASSLHGIARATIAVDVIADISQTHVIDLINFLSDTYYIEEEPIREAINRKSSFNLIHLDTMIKIDVFIHKKDPFNKSAITRKHKDLLVEGDDETDYYFASPEDVILNKLRWYEMTNRVPERQWLDITGVIKVQGDSLDKEYLLKWSEYLKVSRLLKDAFSEADQII
ncbi:MAG TPA: hypothetical protein ENO27_02385 [Caldithrix sp.]|nr:hypothetical protein [Calditrichaceae bacterium]HEM49037.1 hypothetical protein [Caldithrix sp.]